MDETDKDEIDIIDEIRQKRQNKTDGSERLNDVIITQCIICIILVTAVMVLNIACPGISADFIELFKKYSGGETEEALADIIRSMSAALISVCWNLI